MTIDGGGLNNQIKVRLAADAVVVKQAVAASPSLSPEVAERVNALALQISQTPSETELKDIDATLLQLKKTEVPHSILDPLHKMQNDGDLLYLNNYLTSPKITALVPERVKQIIARLTPDELREGLGEALLLSTVTQKGLTDVADILVRKQVITKDALESLILKTDAKDVIESAITLVEMTPGYDDSKLFMKAVKESCADAAQAILMRGFKGTSPFLSAEQRWIVQRYENLANKDPEEALRFLDRVIQLRGLALVFADFGGTSIWQIIHQLPPQKQDDYLAKIEAAYAIPQSQLKVLNKAESAFQKAKELHQLQQREQLSTIMKELEDFQWVADEGVIGFISDVVNRFEGLDRRLKAMKQLIESDSAIEKLHSDDFTLALELAIHDRRWNAVLRILPFVPYPLGRGSTNPAILFLLDKMKHLYQGGNSGEQAFHLSEALEKVPMSQEFSNLSDEEKGHLRPLLGNLQSALRLYTHWDSGVNEVLEVKDQQMAEVIAAAPIGHPVLIPCGSLQHATALMVEKVSATHASVYIFNSSEPVLHPKLKGKSQTFLAYDNVPLEKLTSSSLGAIAGVRHREIEELYTQLEPLGNKRPPSTNPDDYEQMQMQGSCTAQCLMAFLRHQLLQKMPGTSLEKMGAYKFLKARTIMHLAAPQLELLDPEIRGLAAGKIAQLSASLALYEIAKDEKKFSDYVERVCIILTEAGHPDLAKEVNGMKIESSFGRYALLRKCQALMYSIYDDVVRTKAFSRAPPEDFAYLGFLQNKFAHNSPSYLTAMEESWKRGDWIELRGEFCLFVNRFGHEQGSKWLIGKFPDTESVKDHLFLKILAPIVTNSQGLMSKLKEKRAHYLLKALKAASLKTG